MFQLSEEISGLSIKICLTQTPEDIISSGNAAVGFQGGAYPAVRTFAFNVKLRF